MRHCFDTFRFLLLPAAWLLVWAALLAPQVMSAATPDRATQDVAEIRQAILDFAQQQDFGTAERAKVSVGQIDPRLRLQRCDTPLHVAFNGQQRRISSRAFVAVRCDIPTPWTIYVPISLEVFGEVAISRHPLRRGSILHASDIMLARRNLATLPGGYFSDIQTLVGMEVRRPLVGQAVISPHGVSAAKLVRRGERVSLVVDSGGITVRMAGTALADAARGERVSVRNTTSGRVVEGWVKSSGVVTLGH